MFKKSLISIYAAIACTSAYSTTPYTVVDLSGMPHYGEDNYDSWLYNLSPGGGTAIGDVVHFDPNNNTGIETIAIGRYNLTSKTFTPFSLSAMGVTDAGEHVHIFGSTTDGNYLFYWGQNCSGNVQCFSKTGLLTSDGQTSTWITPPTVNGYNPESVSVWSVSSQAIEKYIPLNARYYTGTYGSGSYQTLQKAFVFDLETSSGTEINPLNSGDSVSVRWVKTSDGSLAYGTNWINSSSTTVPFKWTPGGGTTALFSLPTGVSSADIRDVLPDGSVVVGSLWSSNGNSSTRKGFVWNSTGLTEVSPDSGYTYLDLNKIISATKFFGYQYSNGQNSSTQAFVLENGTKTNANTYFGVTQYDIQHLTGFSADGSVVLAYACPASGCSGNRIPDMLLLGVPTPDAVSAPVLNITDVAPQLAATAATVENASVVTSTLINGAHSNPMSHLLKKGERAFWVTGDVGTDDHGYRSGSFGLGEMNLGYNYGNFQVNYSLGRASGVQHLSFGGEVKSFGNFVNVEAIVPVKNHADKFLTVGAFRFQGDASTVRGYDNNGTTDYSTSTANATATGLRARVDWVDAANFKGAKVSPYFDASYVKTNVDGYTEAGGAFPATFAARNDSYAEFRVGASLSKEVQGNMTILSSIELAHRNKDAGPASVGTIASIDFNLPGNTFKQTWAKAGVGFEKKLEKDRKLNVMLNATTQGPAANAWLSANYQARF